MVRRQSKRAPSVSKPLSAVEALMLELEGVDPKELERMSVAAGLPPGQAPDLGAHRAYRMHRSGSAESNAQPSSTWRRRMETSCWPTLKASAACCAP